MAESSEYVRGYGDGWHAGREATPPEPDVPATVRRLILGMVSNERDRQIAKWGDQSGIDATEWCAILGEEFGEACKAALGSRPGSRTGNETLDDLRNELIQTAAVCVQWLEALAVTTPPAAR